MRILLVEDNVELANWIAKLLRSDNFAVDCVYDGEDADHALRVHEFSLVILDLSLPKMDGLEVLRRLRQRKNTVPVIILTANSSLRGRVSGLDEGADDYLAKPFEIAELEARIRVQLRRANNLATPTISYGDITFDLRTREFSIGDKTLTLTPREHAVLEFLIHKAGKTVSKSQICDNVFDFDDEADQSAIEVYVHRLRKKIEGSGVQIKTLRGLGYALQCNEDREP
ncbi:response regulator [Telmatospirillum siberiense]|uniref:DNA-binding response regulator n=1 Tax=Telmatospirillum siberiense TaxID=382514 RepID=A0A2N3PQG0_9PROT|nr:response regulator [Telmatospirillum siberiense]PKU22643.1 DNA-binding response regulator [Telmatospirillum siberiense]